MLWTLDPADRDAFLGGEATKWSSSNQFLAEIACSRSSNDLFLARQAYHSRYKNPLKRMMCITQLGDFRKLCRNVLFEELQRRKNRLKTIGLGGMENCRIEARCVKFTDFGLQQILESCSSLRSLNLYALSSFTDEAYKRISLLAHLEFLDLCGAQNLSDEGLSCIARCKGLLSLNLTWCVRVTDVGVIAIAESCTSLEFLSLFGIVGVTDSCLDSLSRTCSNTITTLDVNGCIGIKGRSRDELLTLFPKLRCFKVHS